MATQVQFEKFDFYNDSLRFRFSDGGFFRVISFSAGVLTIEPPSGAYIYSFARRIAGCFNQDSNLYGVKAIEFTFNEVHVSVTAQTATPEKIVQLWENEMPRV